MIKEESFGVVPLSFANGYWEVFLIQHKGGGYWGFPKGHAERGETPQQSAARELKEETNLDIIRYLQTEPLHEQYTFIADGRRIHKQVFYFVAEVGGPVLLQEMEIHAGMWVRLSEAKNKVTHQEGKTILAQVEKIIPNKNLS